MKKEQAATLEFERNMRMDWEKGLMLPNADVRETVKTLGQLEMSFQADTGECYNEAISAVKGKIIFNSSAGPGWYADARRDIVRNEE